MPKIRRCFPRFRHGRDFDVGAVEACLLYVSGSRVHQARLHVAGVHECLHARSIFVCGQVGGGMITSSKAAIVVGQNAIFSRPATAGIVVD